MVVDQARFVQRTLKDFLLRQCRNFGPIVFEDVCRISQRWTFKNVNVLGLEAKYNVIAKPPNTYGNEVWLVLGDRPDPRLNHWPNTLINLTQELVKFALRPFKWVLPRW